MQVFSTPEKFNLKKKDFKLLSLLAQNARIPIIELAEKCGMTSKTVISKIKLFEGNGLIAGYRAEFDLEKLGFSYYKIHLSVLNKDSSELEELRQYLRGNKNVVYEDFALGGFDVEFEAQFENNEELRKFVDDLKNKFFSLVKDYSLLHYYKEYRLRFMPLES